MADGCMHDWDALGRALALYDQAREMFADNTSAANRATMQDELANLDRRARLCGWNGVEDLRAWAKRRFEGYLIALNAGVSKTHATYTIDLIDKVTSYFPGRGR